MFARFRGKANKHVRSYHKVNRYTHRWKFSDVLADPPGKRWKFSDVFGGPVLPGDESYVEKVEGGNPWAKKYIEGCYVNDEAGNLVPITEDMARDRYSAYQQRKEQRKQQKKSNKD